MEHTRCCFVDGRVVSVVQLFERFVRVGQCVVRAGSIGSVGTDPDYRDRGFGVGVLQDTARFLREDGFDLSMFFTGIRQHYAKAGWVIHPTSSLEVTLSPDLSSTAGDVDIERAVTEDEPSIEAIYDAENGLRTGTIVRSRAYWEARRQWHAGREEAVWVVRRSGRAVAYACEEDGNVREMGRLEGEDEALKSLLVCLWAPLRDQGAEQVRVREPVGGRALIRSIGCEARSRESPNLMLRLVNLRSLIGKIAPLLGARAREADGNRSFGIRFETESDSVTIRYDGGSVAVDDDAPDTNVRLSQSQMLGLIAGRMTVDQVVEANGLNLETQVVDALVPLFPSDPYHHWTWDRRMHAE